MDDALRELVDAWLAKASDDLRAAERLVPDEHEDGYQPLYGAAAFHLQQAAEKTMKAYLASHSVRFAKIHDLSRLIALASTIDIGFDRLDGAAEARAPFSVEVRYPGDWDELTKDEYLQTKVAAEQVIELVAARMAE